MTSTELRRRARVHALAASTTLDGVKDSPHASVTASMAAVASAHAATSMAFSMLAAQVAP